MPKYRLVTCLIVHWLGLKVLDNNTLNWFNACTKPTSYVEVNALGCWKCFPVISRHYRVIREGKV